MIDLVLTDPFGKFFHWKPHLEMFPFGNLLDDLVFYLVIHLAIHLVIHLVSTETAKSQSSIWC